MLRIAVALAVVIVVGLLIVGRPDESIEISELREAEKDLTLATLSDGVTRYQLEGPESGPLILLIHGGREPGWTWDEVVPVLHQAGIRTLRYDMFGRGFSDRPQDAAYDQEFYLKQAEGLLDTLRFSGPLHVAGYSFGSNIAAKLAIARPQQVESLTLLAPRYFGISLPAVVRVPMLNSVIIGKVLKPKVLDDVRGYFQTPQLKQKYANRVGEPTGVIGNFVAFKAFALSDALVGTSDIYRDLNKTGVPVLIVSGGKDLDIPKEHIAGIVSLVPDADQLVYSEANHGLVWQNGVEIAREMAEFVGATSK